MQGCTGWGPPKGPALALISLYDTENNAVRQLAAGLRQQGQRVVEVYFKDWSNNHLEAPSPAERASLIRLLQAEGVGLVGLSLRASAYQSLASQLCQELRQACQVPVVVGGWHAIVRPEACLEFADAACVGEGDLALPALARAYFHGSPAQVFSTPGFYFRCGDTILRQPPAQRVLQLDRLPWRDYHSPDKWFIHGDRLTQGDPMAQDPLYQVSCTLGCINRCAFCHESFYPDNDRPPLRFRSVSSIIAELRARQALGHHFSRVRFDDEIFGLSLPWLEELAQRWPREVGLPFDVLTEPSVVTPRYASLLAKAGCQFVHMGLQSTPAVNAQQLSRRSSDAQDRRAIQLLTAEGLSLRYLVMVDIPGAGEEALQQLFTFFQSVPRPYDLYLFSLTWFPGSRMVEDMLRDGQLQPEQVEGLAQKTFSQYRVDLRYPRPEGEWWWVACLVLQASQLLPPKSLERLAFCPPEARRPALLRPLVQAATLAKTARVALEMVRHGELTPTLIRRWWNPAGLITM